MNPRASAADTPAPGRVTVRYWASARAAAGRESDLVPAGTVAEALAAVREVHAGRPEFGRLIGICSVLVGSQPLGRRDPADVALDDGDLVELLPPFAGG